MDQVVISSLDVCQPTLHLSHPKYPWWHLIHFSFRFIVKLSRQYRGFPDTSSPLNIMTFNNTLHVILIHRLASAVLAKICNVGAGCALGAGGTENGRKKMNEVSEKTGRVKVR